MALDMHYQAMPEHCSLLARSRQEPEFGELLAFFTSIAKEVLSGNCQDRDNPTWADFTEEVKRTIQLYPAIEQRECYLGRSWDILYYLLSEKRRQDEPRDGTSLIEKAIFGGDILHPAVTTTIGHPIRYLPPAEVHQVVNLLSEVTIEVLRVNYNPLAMSEVAVYKIHEDDDEEAFSHIQQDFEKLKAFYEEVATHNEGVLTCLS
ncbi:MAG TPA: DUF1877 family protein [Coleofasciculaceae cyanobacterium]